MMISSLTYLVVQVPAIFYSSDPDGGVMRESKFAITGLVLALAGFLAYLVLQLIDEVSSCSLFSHSILRLLGNRMLLSC